MVCTRTYWRSASRSRLHKTDKRSTALRRRAEPKGRHSPAQGGGPRDVRSQVRPAAVLQHYAVRSMWRFPQVFCRHAVRRLQIYLSHKVLYKRGYEMYQQVKRRNGSRRGEDQPPYSSSFREIRQHECKLVLPLRLYFAIRKEELQKVHWYVLSMIRKEVLETNVLKNAALLATHNVCTLSPISVACPWR
jgi:hypothetical protein